MSSQLVIAGLLSDLNDAVLTFFHSNKTGKFKMKHIHSKKTPELKN